MTEPRIVSPTEAWDLAEAATPGPWEVYDPNEGMWPPRPLWSIANDAYHNPPADEDAPWLAFNAYLETGMDADANLIAAAPDLAHTVVVLGNALERIEEALARHPEPCTDTPYTCGWKRAVVDVRAALTGGDA